MVSYHDVQYQNKLIIQSLENFETDEQTDGLTDRQMAASKYKMPIYSERAMLFGSFHFYILRYKKSIVLKRSWHTNTCPKAKAWKPGGSPNYINIISPCPMHNAIQNAYNPGLVFRVLQYLNNSDINIYPTVIIILKFWVVLEQILSVKKGPNILWSENCCNLVYPRWQDKNSDLSPPPFHKMVFRRLETTPLYSIADSAVLVWLQKYGKF